MNEKTIFVRTASGDDEIRSKTAHLSKDIKRALFMVDGTATVAEIIKRSSPSLRVMLQDMFVELERGGFIQDKARAGKAIRLVTPSVAPVKSVDDVDELDFTAAYRAPTPEVLAAEAVRAKTLAATKAAEEVAAKARAVAEERVRLEAEVAKFKLQQQLESERRAADQAAEKERADAVAREEQAHRGREEAEAARIKAESQAARIRVAAEAHARAAAEERARLQAEVAMLKSQAEAEARAAAEEKARREAEVARVRAEQEAASAKAEARAAAEEKARREAEAARVKAEQEAESARAEARAVAEEKARQEAEVARARAEQEVASARAEARAAAEEKARREAEAARVKAEQEAASARAEALAAAEEKARREAEAAHARAEQEAASARAEALAVAEEKARREAEAASIKAEQEVASARAEAEARAEQRAREEAEAFRIKTEEHAAKVRAEAEANARAASEERARLEAEVAKLKAQAELEAMARVEAAEQAKREEALRVSAEQEADRIRAEARAVAEASREAARAKAEQEVANARAEAESRAEQRAKEAAEQRAREKTEAERIKAERLKAEADARAAADEKAALEAEVAELKRQAEAEMRAHIALEAQAARVKAEQDAMLAREASVEVAGGAAVMPDAVGEAGEIPSADSLEPFDLEAFKVALSLPQHEAPAQADSEFTENSQQTGIAELLLNDAAGLGEAVPAEPEKTIEKAPEEPVVEPEEPVIEPVQRFSEQEARELAQMQAKTWAEAEQRALELARQSSERAARQAAEQLAAPTVIARPRRKPLPWGKLAAGLFVLVLLAAFVVPYLLPTERYREAMEQVLGKKLQQPVHVGHLSGRILPTPRLLLSDVSIGETKQIQSRQVQVDFAFSALTGANHSINRLILDGVTVQGVALQQVVSWLQQVVADPQYPVAHITLSQGKLEAEGLQLSELEAELDFDPSGRFTLANLSANGHKLSLNIQAADAQKMNLDIVLTGSALPLFPNWVFDELKAKGELSRDELRLTGMDGRILGGVLTGEARINWRSGWRVQGAIEAKVIPLQNINPLMSGDLDGTAHFQMQAAKLAGLSDAAVLNGIFSVRKGIISGVDMVETARLRSREKLPGGRTHFDELSGELNYANGIYRFSPLKISDSVLHANGALTIDKQKLSGNIAVELLMRMGNGAATLRVGGTSEDPSLVAVP